MNRHRGIREQLLRPQAVVASLLILVVSSSGCGSSHYDKGANYLKHQRPGRAEQEFQAALEEDPEDVRCHIGLARVDLMKKRYDQSLDHLRDALRYAPSSVEARTYMAQTYLERGQYDLVVQVCQEGLGIQATAELHRLLGSAYLGKSDLSSAQAAFQAATELDVDNAEGWVGLVQVHIRNGDIELAEQVCGSYLSGHPDDELVRWELARIYELQERIDEAEQVYRALEKLSPQHAGVYLALGSLYIRSEKLDQAIEAYETVLELVPNDLTAHMNLIRIHNRESQFEQARKVSQQLARLIPTEQSEDSQENSANESSRNTLREFVLVNRARASIGLQDYLDAIEALKEWVHLAPKNPLAHYRLGLAYAGVKNQRQAVSAYKQALKLEPSLLVAHTKLAIAYLAQGRHDQALEECQKLIGSEDSHAGDAPLQSEAHYLSGVTRLALGELEAAEADFQEALRLDPESAQVCVALGDVSHQRGQDEQAFTYYEMAVERDPQSTFAHQRMADLHALRKEADKATEAYGKALESGRVSASAYNALAWHYATQSTNLPVALELAQKAVSMAPSIPEYRDTLGWIYYQQGDYTQAITELTTASLGRDNNPSICYHLGMAHYANGELQEAAKQLGKALDQGSSFIEAKEAEQVLKQIQAGQ